MTGGMGRGLTQLLAGAELPASITHGNQPHLQQSPSHHNTCRRCAPWRPCAASIKLGVRNILSMGCGIQTVAYGLEYDPLFDLIMFADTGDERPETYAYLEKYVKPHFGDRFVVVKNPKWNSIYDQCMEQNIAPDKTTRWCTNDYKVRPIQRYLRKLGATAAHPVAVHIGFSIDEYKRYNPNKKHPKYIKYAYRLLDDHLTRKQCEDIVRNHGWPVPPKSRCWHCPFQGRRSVRALKAEHPDLFNKLLQIESGVKDKMKHPYMNERNLSGISENNTLDDYCDEGYCMT